MGCNPTLRDGDDFVREVWSVGLDPIGATDADAVISLSKENHPNKPTLMKKLILASLVAVALLSLPACSSDKSSRTTTRTSEETTIRSPVTTTTTDTKTTE